MSKKKKKRKRPYRPRKPATAAPRPTAVNPLLQSMEVMQKLKPVIDTARKVQARRRERAQEAETD